MNVKKSLENRIRGWFPKEPILISTRVKVNREVKQPPLMIPQEFAVSATKIVVITTILWTIFYGLSTFFWFNIFSYSSIVIIGWIIAGSTAGIISGKLYTQNQLIRISREIKIFGPNKKDMILSAIPIIILFSCGFPLNWFLFDSLIRQSALLGVLASLYAAQISQQVTRYVVFRRYEKKENMRLVQSWLGGGLAVIPKAPHNKDNGYS